MMKIEITATANEFSKRIFNIDEIVAVESLQLKNKLDEIALEKLLHTEPAANHSSKDSEKDIVKKSKQLPTSLLDEYRDAFALFDQKGDGKVAVQELHRIMLSLGQYIKFAELREVLDTNQVPDEYFSFEQFVDILLLFSDSTQAAEELRKTFRVFDKRNTGYITSSDLRNIWLSFDISLSSEEIDQMIGEVDTDGDGRINFDEFVNALIVLEENDQH